MTLWVTSVFVCRGASQRIPLSVLVRKPDKGVAMRPEGGGKEGPRDQSAGESSQEKDTVSRKEQKGPVDSTGQSGDESRAKRRPINRSQKGGC